MVWVIVIALFIVLGRQAYLDVSQFQSKFKQRLKIFIIEFITTTLTLIIVYEVGILAGAFIKGFFK